VLFQHALKIFLKISVTKISAEIFQAKSQNIFFTEESSEFWVLKIRLMSEFEDKDQAES
jgi:hypothetical protein